MKFDCIRDIWTFQHISRMKDVCIVCLELILDSLLEDSWSKTVEFKIEANRLSQIVTDVRFMNNEIIVSTRYL